MFIIFSDFFSSPFSVCCFWQICKCISGREPNHRVLNVCKPLKQMPNRITAKKKPQGIICVLVCFFLLLFILHATTMLVLVNPHNNLDFRVFKTTDKQRMKPFLHHIFFCFVLQAIWLSFSYETMEIDSTRNNSRSSSEWREKKTLIIKGHAHFFFNQIITTIRARNDDEYNLKGDVKS